MFKLISSFKPTGDQPNAIKKLTEGINRGTTDQVLLGVTGSGKTFTMANVIEKTQLPTLVISHNKTLAAQLYQEFRDFFPENAVSFFISYYDYYQPEAYIPQTDTYIEKETEINELIERLRLKTTTNLLTRKDAIVVASVSCIYNLGSPREYGNFVLELYLGQKISRIEILKQLARLQYEKSDFDFSPGFFRTRGEIIDVFPAYEEFAVRIETSDRGIKNLIQFDPLGKKTKNFYSFKKIIIYPAKHYMANPSTYDKAFSQIRNDLKIQVEKFKKLGKILEAQRLEARVNYDLEMIKELGYVNGIENYSRYFDGRKPGEPPYTLLDYFYEAYGSKWLCFIDESHITIPQLRGMVNGDKSRKEVLINYGFRLPAALDNRPLTFEEFLERTPYRIYFSATPDFWEIKKAKGRIIEQLIRPTGLLDPEIVIKPAKGQIDDLMIEIEKRKKQNERVLVTTLTKRMAEDLSDYLREKGFKVHYLHSEIETLERSDILDDLRLGKYEVIVGVNLLREGLDLPEVSLVAILDADKEGFLRSQTSLIQTMGRAARHIHGQIILFADQITSSIEKAIKEINRRRQIQIKYNKIHHVIPHSIEKPIRERLIEEDKNREYLETSQFFENKYIKNLEEEIDIDQLTPEEKEELIKKLKKQMKIAARDLNFELAAKIRDMIRKITAD